MGWGWGGVGHVNVRWHLRHEVDATPRMGWGWGGVGVGHVNVRWHLRHEVDAMPSMGFNSGYQWSIVGNGG